MGGIGATEIIIIAVLILVFFGAKKFPDIARSMGKGLKEFKKASSEFTQPLKESMRDDPKNIAHTHNHDMPNKSHEHKEAESKAPTENKQV